MRPIKAFTLIELLYVMAFFIIVVPVVGPLIAHLISLGMTYVINHQ
ncbi:MAG: type II secretion system protein [Gammaproteobacteria bacterium]